LIYRPTDKTLDPLEWIVTIASVIGELTGAWLQLALGGSGDGTHASLVPTSAAEQSA